MKIGILGAGNVGGTLGTALMKAGHQVLYGVRDVAAVQGSAGSPAEAVAFGDVVINALPWPATEGALKALDLKGKVLLDATNPLLPKLSGLEYGTTTSGGEKVAEWASGAKVVKVFNTTGFGNMGNPVYEGKAIPMFYAGDDAEAKAITARLVADIGFEPVDSGSLANARLLEPFAMLWIWLANFGGLGREIAFQIVKR